jgi:hypothetical protein
VELNTRFKCPLMETNSFELRNFSNDCYHGSVNCSHCLLILDMQTVYNIEESELPKKWRVDFNGFFEQKGMNI